MGRRRPRCSCSQRGPAKAYAIATKPDGSKYPRVLCDKCFSSWKRTVLSISATEIYFKLWHSGAHHGADGSQVSRDDYDEFKRTIEAERNNDIRSIALAASALVAVASEPESELEDSQIEAIAPVANAGRRSSVHAQTGESIEQAARAVASGHLQEEISSILAGKQEKPSRELVNGVKQISKLVLKQGTFVVYTRLRDAGWAASAFGEQLQKVIVERRKKGDGNVGNNHAGILGFRTAWPRPVVDALMRAVMPKSMHGLDLATCKAQLEPGKWKQKELRVCAALELLATAADNKHKTLARALMMAQQCGEEPYHQLMQDLGLDVTKSTKSDNLKQLVAKEKALNEKALEQAPTWWLAFACFDNLVALPKTTPNARAMIQPFLFFARPLAHDHAAGLRPPGESVQPAMWKADDEQLFTKNNFIYGYDAIEELNTLPQQCVPLASRPWQIATIAAPIEPFVGALRLTQSRIIRSIAHNTDRKNSIPVRIDPHVGDVTEAAVRDMLQRIEKALKIGSGLLDRHSATVICDSDIRRHIATLIKKSSSHEFGWVRLQPAEWHASLCFRLTIGATWGEIFLFKMVEEVEGVTENTAAHVASGKRWRRSGNIGMHVARGATRFLLQWYLRSLRNDEQFDYDAFHRWLEAKAENNSYVGIIYGYIKAVALNLELDEAIRRGDYDAVIKISAIFHWLTVSRGRNNYKQILAEQLANWALSNEEERDAIKQATFCINHSGRFNALDETYESMLKIVKQFLRRTTYAPSIANAINCTYAANVFTRLKLELEQELGKLRTKCESTRPRCIKTERNRQRVIGYAKCFEKWVQCDAIESTEIKAYHTGAIVRTDIARVFEDGQFESETIVKALIEGWEVYWDNGDEWLPASGNRCDACTATLPPSITVPALASHSSISPPPLLAPLSPTPSSLSTPPAQPRTSLLALSTLLTSAPPPPPTPAPARPQLFVSRRRAQPAIAKETAAKRARALKGQLTETEKQLEAAKHATQKERVKRKRLQGSAIEEAELEGFSKTDLVEILNETGGAVCKKDTRNDLAAKVRNRNPEPIQDHQRPKKSARVAEDANELLPLIQREKSSSGRTLKPSTWRRDLGAEK